MQTALEAVREYYAAFSTLDLNAITSHFAEPCMLVGPQTSFSAENRDSLARALTPLVESLRTKGYKRSDFVDAQVISVSATVTLVKGTAVRFDTAGAELERVQISYLTQQRGADWKIAVMVL